MISRSAIHRPQRIELADNQVLALKGRRLEIACLAGLIWLTDGAGGDRVIRKGQQTTLGSKSRICVQAFAPSVIRIRPADPVAYRKEKSHDRSLHDAAVEC
jgi:hypothetical protein